MRLKCNDRYKNALGTVTVLGDMVLPDNHILLAAVLAAMAKYMWQRRVAVTKDFRTYQLIVFS